MLYASGSSPGRPVTSSPTPSSASPRRTFVGVEQHRVVAEQQVQLTHVVEPPAPRRHVVVERPLPRELHRTPPGRPARTGPCSPRTNSRPRRWTCSSGAEREPVLARVPGAEDRAGLDGSTGNPVSRSNAPSAASNAVWTRLGSGPQPTRRASASARAGIPSGHRERVRQRGRVTRAPARPRSQEEPSVGDRRRERAERREVDPFGDRLAADHAVRGLQAGQTAERRRDPDRASAVRRGGDRRHAGCDRGRRPAARPARRPLRAPRVPRRAVQEVVRVTRRTRTRAGSSCPPRSAPAARRRAASTRPRRPAARPRTPSTRSVVGMPWHVLHVLHQQRDARQWPDVLTCSDPTVERTSLVHGLLANGDHRVDRRVQPFDPLERHPHELLGRHTPTSYGR